MTENVDKSLAARMRMDFVFDVLEANDETRVARIALRPDPRRYDAHVKNGKTYYLDRYENIMIGADTVDDMLSQLGGMPVYNLSPSIDNSINYATLRQKAVEHELETGEHITPAEPADPHKPLDETERGEWLVFLSVDVCGSTSARASAPSQFDQAMTILIRELGNVVGQFHGTIFKLTGDGFIAYVRHASINSACDTAVDLGLTFLVVLCNSVNPALRKVGIEELAIRVGADFGEAEIKRIRIPGTGFETTDIASDALNRAAKIQQSCKPNELRVGQRLRSLLHVQWLERTHEETPQNSYQLYSVR